jgi:hypothetical protein
MCVASLVSMSAIQILTWLFVLQELRIRKNKVDNGNHRRHVRFPAYFLLSAVWIASDLIFCAAGVENLQLWNCLVPLIRCNIHDNWFIWEIAGVGSDFSSFVNQLRISVASLPKRTWRILGSNGLCSATVALIGHLKEIGIRTDITRPDHVQIWWPSNFNCCVWSTLESGALSLLH